MSIQQICRRIILYLAVATLIVSMLGVACGGSDGDAGPGTGPPKYGGSLVVTLFADFFTLDPPLQINSAEIIVTQATYDNLVMVQPDLSLKPMLATHWEASNDLASYTFHLRQGVKFHHGKDFKAEDVVSTFTRLVDPELDSPARTTFNVIEEMVILDDYTVRFDLTAPNAFFPESLSVYQARIVPSDVDPARLSLEEFGTGPFMITSHSPGEQTVMTRNPDYWETGRPYLDEVTVLLIPEPATRAEALKSGDVDVIFLLEALSASGLDAHPDTVVSETASSSYLGMYMNMDVEPFDNVLVRKAIQAATDREAINQAALLGRGVIANDHPIPPNDPHFASQYAPPDYDPELARSLLEQAGYPDGIDLTLYTSSAGAPLVEVAVAFKEMAAPAGIRVDIQRVGEDIFWTEVWLVKPFATVFWNGRPPDQALSIVYPSDANWNESNYNNPTVDQLIVQARGQNLEERKATYGEIQRILIDEVPRTLVVFQPILFGMRSDVRGLEAHPMSWLILNDTWLDR